MRRSNEVKQKLEKVTPIRDCDDRFERGRKLLAWFPVFMFETHCNGGGDKAGVKMITVSNHNVITDWNNVYVSARGRE